MERASKRPGRPAGFVGTVNRAIEYRCATCGVEAGRENLLAKRVGYYRLSKPQKLVRSRTVKWLCVGCAEAEQEFQQEAIAASPGMRDTKLARSASADAGDAESGTAP